jgi:hypothetical protein
MPTRFTEIKHHSSIKISKIRKNSFIMNKMQFCRKSVILFLQATHIFVFFIYIRYWFTRAFLCHVKEEKKTPTNGVCQKNEMQFNLTHLNNEWVIKYLEEEIFAFDKMIFFFFLHILHTYICVFWIKYHGIGSCMQQKLNDNQFLNTH